MKYRPMLFSAPMVRSLLNDTKSHTRRIAKPVRHPDWGNIYTPDALVNEPQHVIERACPYGQPGDRIWVRETWAYGIHAIAANTDTDGPFVYAADGTTQGRLCDRWRPSIHMPRTASRITLEITRVRLERLQDISELDAISEGVEPNWIGELTAGPNGFGGFGWVPDCGWIDYLTDVDGDPAPTAVKSFMSLWQSINGPESWDANPLVWVVEFSRNEGGTA